MSGIFRFKQFAVDQNGCAMKINTDGVLLGALVNYYQPQTILDIGTGTGVIALMLAQRYTNAIIDAIEIDETAAKTANANFTNSPFKERLTVYPQSFAGFFENFPGKKYDLVVANPPFYIHSLKSTKANTSLAKHADEGFFEELIAGIYNHLTKNGEAHLILPLQTASLVKQLAIKNKLHLHKIINLHSFKADDPHREIIALGPQEKKLVEENFVFYDEPNQYTKTYREALKDFLTIF